MKPLTAKEVAFILLAHGFVLSRTRGSHFIYSNKESGISIPVPFHNNGTEELTIGTFMAIIRESKIPKKEFEK